MKQIIPKVLNIIGILMLMLTVTFLLDSWTWNLYSLITFIVGIFFIILSFFLRYKNGDFLDTNPINWFDWTLRIIGIASFILGAWGIEQSNHAGLAGIAVFFFSLPFLVVPIFVSLALKSWKRLGTYLLCLIACPYIALYTAIPFYFYFRLMKNAYIKQIILYYVIPFSISSAVALIIVPIR